MKTPTLIRGAIVASLLAFATAPLTAQTAAPPGSPPRPARPAARGGDQFEGYDFGQVVETLETSVNPLQREMDRSFRVFVETIQEAETLLDEGDAMQAVEKAAAALDVVLAARQNVLEPMWDGQQVLAEQIAIARERLALAVQASARPTEARLDEATESTLDGIAARVSEEQNPLRRKRLVAHYRTVRNLARIRTMAMQLSPDQRKLWMNVLHVLDEAALAHQQVMMGSEVLFAQFEATSGNLRAYLELMETVDGASRLIHMVRGVDDGATGMSGFAQSMNDLQDRLSTFNQSVEQALEGRMLELEAELDMIEPLPGEFDPGGGIPLDEDMELSERIDRLSQGGGTREQGDRP